MELYYYICPDPQAPFTEEEKALFPLLSPQKRALCGDPTARTARMSFYGEIFALWLWYKANSDATSLKGVRYLPHGKPCIEDGACYSLSHTHKGIFFAMDSTPVGIDAERPRKVNFSVAERYFSPEDCKKLRQASNPDRLYTTLWTKFEAYGKYLGTGIKRHNLALSVTHSRATSPRVRGVSAPKGSPITAATTITLSDDYIVSVYPPADPPPSPILIYPEKVYADLKKFL